MRPNLLPLLLALVTLTATTAHAQEVPQAPPALEAAPALPPPIVAPPLPPAAPGFVPDLRMRDFGRAPRHPRAVSLYISGLSLFAVSYVPLSIYAIRELATEGTLFASATAQLPVIGAITEGAIGIKGGLETNDGKLGALGAVLLVDGLAQAAGLTMAIVGDVLRRRDLKEMKTMVVPTGTGLAVAGRF